MARGQRRSAAAVLCHRGVLGQAGTDLAVVVGCVHTRMDHVQQRVHQPLTGSHLLPRFLPRGAEIPRQAETRGSSLAAEPYLNDLRTGDTAARRSGPKGHLEPAF